MDLCLVFLEWGWIFNDSFINIYGNSSIHSCWHRICSDLGSSVSGALAHSRKKNIDYEIGIFLLIGGIFGSTIGVILFNFLKESGNIDLIINILYVIFLSVIGILMLIESTISLVKDETKIIRKKKKKKFSRLSPLKN